MILLSCRGWPPAAIAELLSCHPATVRRWIHRYNTHGTAGLADQARPGRPRLGSPRLGERIRRLLAQPTAWTIGRLWKRLGRPAMSLGTLHRRVREVAVTGTYTDPFPGGSIPSSAIWVLLTSSRP
jgi:transposase